MVWQPNPVMATHTDTPADPEDLPCPIEQLHEFLTNLVYPENEPGVFKRKFSGADVAEAGLNLDLIYLQLGRLLRQ